MASHLGSVPTEPPRQPIQINYGPRDPMGTTLYALNRIFGSQPGKSSITNNRCRLWRYVLTVSPSMTFFEPEESSASVVIVGVDAVFR